MNFSRVRMLTFRRPPQPDGRVKGPRVRPAAEAVLVGLGGAARIRAGARRAIHLSVDLARLERRTIGAPRPRLDVVESRNAVFELLVALTI